MFICVCSSCFQTLGTAACCFSMSDRINVWGSSIKHGFSFTLFVCHPPPLYPSDFCSFHSEDWRCSVLFPAGNLDFWSHLLCLEAEIKSVNSVSVLSITSSNNLLHARFIFFMFSPPWGSSFFYVALISLVLAMLSVQCTLILLFITSPCKPCLEEVFWRRKLLYKVWLQRKSHMPSR